MVQAAKHIRITEAEIEVADRALDEFERYGRIATACPRCGSELQAEIATSSEKVWCVKGDFEMTARGI